MTEFLHDPDLDRLVRDLNEDDELEGPEGVTAVPPPGEAPARPRLTSPRRLEVDTGEPLEQLLATLVRHDASDLHLVPGQVPRLRVQGRLQTLRVEGGGLSEGALPEVGALFAEHLDARGLEALETRGAMDFTLRRRDRRFRVNLHRQGGRLAASVRALPARVPTLDELHLPEQVAQLAEAQRGLVLLTGPAGSGKSSTLAALVDHLNRRQPLHILTIEDPVEYQHASREALVQQVEIGVDSPSFPEALHAALRQDPDVLLVGEMRDLETMATAITAAETGHLVLATLHTTDPVQAIHRMVDVFDSRRQDQIRQQLSMALHAIVGQQLLPREDTGGRIPAVEVLRATYPVRHLIRKNELQKLYNEITRGRAAGMISMEESLVALVRQGMISLDEARLRTLRPEELESLLG